MHQNDTTRHASAAALALALGAALTMAAAPAIAADAAKEKCYGVAMKGKNDCKGQGGCKTGDNGCKGKNSCKGKGGCNTMPKKPK